MEVQRLQSARRRRTERQRLRGAARFLRSRPEGCQHVACAESICREMAKYPRKLCQIVFRGLTAQMRADRRLIPGCYSVQMAETRGTMGVEDSPTRRLRGPAPSYSDRFKDELTGQMLKDSSLWRPEPSRWIS